MGLQGLISNSVNSLSKTTRFNCFDMNGLNHFLGRCLCSKQFSMNVSAYENLSFQPRWFSVHSWNQDAGWSIQTVTPERNNQLKERTEHFINITPHCACHREREPCRETSDAKTVLLDNLLGYCKCNKSFPTSVTSHVTSASNIWADICYF